MVAWQQADIRSSDIQPGAATADDDVVTAAIRAAAARGLRALLFPILILDRVAAGEWRGVVAPDDIAAWWQAYEAFIGHYADLAAAEGAPALLIGSELGSTESWRDRWFHLISRVERRYDGELVYSANWDHYRQVSFWKRVDYVGVTGYVELTAARDAGEDELGAAWVTARDALVAYAAEVGKPLVLTEVGYPSRDGAAARPWDYTSEGAVDLEEQRRAFAALARAWDGVHGLAGLYVWAWDGDGGAADRGYTPRGKPAEQVLRAWFRGEPLD